MFEILISFITLIGVYIGLLILFADKLNINYLLSIFCASPGFLVAIFNS